VRHSKNRGPMTGRPHRCGSLVRFFRELTFAIARSGS
jgi:hypothetical protein